MNTSRAVRRCGVARTRSRLGPGPRRGSRRAGDAWSSTSRHAVCGSRSPSSGAAAAPARPTPGCSGSGASAHGPDRQHGCCRLALRAARPRTRATRIYDGDRRLAGASTQRRPRFYDLSTADGIPYWKIALLHLDSFASTVVQTCAYWGNDDQCKFCGIGVSLDAGRTIVKKSPGQLAEVAVAAKELDGAVDATLTTGSSNGVDRGALYVARCGHAVQGGHRPARRGAVRAARRPRRHRRGRRHGHRLGRASTSRRSTPRAGPRRPGQGPHRHRAVLPRLGARRGPLRRGPGLDLRHPRHGRGSRAHRRGLSTGHRHGRVPVRRAAPAGRRQPDGGRRAAGARSTPSASTARWPPTCASAGWTPSVAKAGCARCQACSGLQSVQALLQIGPSPVQISHAV